MMNSLMMNSMLVKVTDRGWQKLCKPTDRQQKGCQNWQSGAVQNAVSSTHSLSYLGYSDKNICGYDLSYRLHYYAVRPYVGQLLI